MPHDVPASKAFGYNRGVYVMFMRETFCSKAVVSYTDVNSNIYLFHTSQKLFEVLESGFGFERCGLGALRRNVSCDFSPDSHC